MKKLITLLTILVMTGIELNSQTASKPVIIKFVKKRSAKPPLNYFRVNILISNTHDSLRWYLFPYNFNRTLNQKGVFEANITMKKGYFNVLKFSDTLSLNQIVEVKFVGGDYFIAFCIPPKSTMTFENFEFESFGDSMYKKMECWEVSDLLVNGKTPLNLWLPQTVISSPNAHFKGNPRGLYFDYHITKQGSHIKYPDEIITFIQAIGIKKMQTLFE